jgi:Protein of unknown function DUF45
MTHSPSGARGSDLLALLLALRAPGVGQQGSRSGGGPLAAGELLEDPLEVLDLVDAVEAGRGDDAHQAGDVLELVLVAEEQRQLPPDRDAPEAPLGVSAAGYRVSDAKGRWGSCGRDRVLRIHWRLVQAPAPALEYVVAHEVAHLVHRNHSPEFWQALGRALPDWGERKAMLERWEAEHRAV